MSGGISWNDPRVSIHWWVTDAMLSPWDVRLAPLA
jgi:dTDP-4-dehydrorhamnose 3,5-epimerase-like enzyme